MGICHSYTPDGRCVSLLKVLLTNYCIFDCQYCVNRVSSDTPRARFAVDEVVRLTLDFYKRNYIEGLFLSSGIIRDFDYTMQQLTEVARRLREDHHYGGYIHLKTIPGADEALIREAGRWADRLSINVELPTAADLKTLAPEKKPEQIDSAMEKAVRRDAHKMKAFVRFRRVEREGMEHFVAWHRPDHRIVRRTAPFFARRFAGMRWSILTPDESASWDGQALTYGPGVPGPRHRKGTSSNRCG